MALTTDAIASQSSSRDFSVLQQAVELDINFANQSLKGSTEVTIIPFSKDLRQIRLNCRQSKISYLTVEGKAARFDYREPYRKLKPHATWDVHQFHMLKDRLEPHFGDSLQEELVIKLPKSVVVQESNPLASQQDGFFARAPKGAGSNSAALDTPPASAAEISASYNPMTVKIRFEIPQIRDGLHFVGVCGNDQRFPHAYTTNSPFVGSASALFPCVDDPSVRCHWNITVKCAKTLGDALEIPLPSGDGKQPGNEEDDDDEVIDPYAKNRYGLTEEERAYDMIVACSGALMDEDPSSSDDSRKTASFACDLSVSANQIGIAIGPFTKVDISAEFRESDDDEKVGDEALTISALCLPGRGDEVRNTAFPMARAADYFSSTFVTHAFPVYQMCFVDDLESDTVVNAALSFCSSRLLFPPEIIDPIYDATRKLVHSLAVQYSGIGIAPREPSDIWCITGMAHFMADLFMKQICGNNEYRFQQKLNADKIFELDFERPSIHTLGSTLHLDPSLNDFVDLKANVVLFILDRRLAKSSGTTGMAKIIMRTLSNAKSSFDSEGTLLSTAQFQRTCEKIGHCKLETFFQQWVFGAGCPQFAVSQRFNKKKLVVEMQIQQVQGDLEYQSKQSRNLSADYFIRDVNEDTGEVWAAGTQNVFTGPMTIRIHEADGTPYEHIVDIKDRNTKIEIPYNTKYKRLKRSRRQKERAAANAGVDLSAEPQDDTLLYCLGDVLEAEEEVADWRLTDWSKEEEEKMSQESYEWIRMDADFEWICRMQIGMPAYMYVSQLQQDRDVVAQYDSLQWIASQSPHPLISTFLTRTIMDRRYFHGIRTAATAILPKCATSTLQWIGLVHLEKIYLELFCSGNASQTQPNDFADRAGYLLQCAIPKAMSRIRDASGVAPTTVKRFFLDKLKFNDNSSNEFSDNFYVAMLMSCMARSLIKSPDDTGLPLDEEEQEEEEHIKKEAISEIERYRRIDEWVSSYHNIYSVTALDCLLRLAKSQLLEPKLADFLRYTHQGNADAVRLEAFRCLTELGGLRNGPILKYFLRNTGSDMSPYMRQRTFASFGRGLGLIAIGEDKPEPKRRVESGLVVEEGSTDARQADLARKQTIVGAMAALRAEIGTMPELHDGLWVALTSPVATLADVWRLLGICDLLIEPKNSMIAILKYPRWWKCEKVGDGKVRFYQTDRIRTKPRNPMEWVAKATPATNGEPPAHPPPPPSRKPSMKINLGGRLQTQATTGAPPVTETPAPPTPAIPTAMAPPVVPETPKVIPATVPVLKQELKSPVSVSKPRQTSKPRKQYILKLKCNKLQEPEYQRKLASIVPRPAAARPHTAEEGAMVEGRPSSSAGPSMTLKLNVGNASGSFRMPQSPALKAEPSSPDALEAGAGTTSPNLARRQSSVASVSTPGGTKRKSETPLPVQPSIETNGTGMNGNDEHGMKRLRSGTPSSRRSESGTPAGSSPAANKGLSVPAGQLSNSKKRKSDVSVDADGPGFAVSSHAQAKKLKSATPSRGKKKSLIVRLRISSMRLKDKLAALANGNDHGNALTSGPRSESSDVPLAAKSHLRDEAADPLQPSHVTKDTPTYGPIQDAPKFGPITLAPSYGPVQTKPANVQLDEADKTAEARQVLQEPQSAQQPLANEQI